MGYLRKTIRRMRPRQRRVAEIQMELESTVRKIKKLVDEVGAVEDDATVTTAPTRPTGVSIEDGKIVATPPCPDVHYCWKCGHKTEVI